MEAPGAALPALLLPPPHPKNPSPQPHTTHPTRPRPPAAPARPPRPRPPVELAAPGGRPERLRLVRRGWPGLSWHFDARARAVAALHQGQPASLAYLQPGAYGFKVYSRRSLEGEPYTLSPTHTRDMGGPVGGGGGGGRRGRAGARRWGAELRVRKRCASTTPHAPAWRSASRLGDALRAH